jgi:predicted Zn-dependent protease
MEEAGPGRKEKMGATLRDALLADPDSKELLALAGGHAIETDNYGLAIERLERALQIDPGYGPALVWLGTAYDKLGRKAEAVAAAQRAVAARPGPVSYAVLAQSLAINGQRDEAVAAARRVYGFGGPVPYFVSEMVWPVHAYVGDWKQAEDEVRRWTGSDSLPARRMMSLSALSFLLNAQGRAAEIREVAAQLGEGPPPELSVWAMAMADLLEGNDAGAARQIREAAGVDGAAVVAYLGDLRGADVLARELKAGSVPADLHRAVDAWRRGSPATAVPILREVIARTDDGGAIRYLGEILCEGEQPAAGAALLEKWLGRFPSAVSLGMFVFRPRVLIHLAKCQDRLGRRPEARATVQRFLSEWNRADSGLPLLAEAKAMQARLADAPK